MRLLRNLFYRVRGLVRAETIHREIEEEARFHIEMRIDENMRRGMSPEEARRDAERRFGNLTRMKERGYEVRGGRWLETLWQDIRYGFRCLRRSPMFTAMAALSLAIGIGANVAVFSVINAVMLKMLPVHEPERLVEFLSQYPGDPALNYFSRTIYEHFRDNNRALAGITGVASTRFSVKADGVEPELVEGEYVIGSFFQLLGLKPVLGRLIEPDDDRPGTNAYAAVISWPYWKRRFNLDPGVVGRTIALDNAVLTIVGVAPRTFSGLRVGAQPDIWTPSVAYPAINPSNPQGSVSFQLVARLASGTSLEQARSEFAALFTTLQERTQNSKDPQMRRLTFEVRPAGSGLSTGLRDRFEKPLVVTLAVVALLLLLACTNVASMLLARAVTRQREMSVRLSLGASRGRLARQLLTEALLLASIGGLFGIGVAWAGSKALVNMIMKMISFGPPLIGMSGPLEIHATPDRNVLLFTVGVSLLTGLVFGLAPAWTVFKSVSVSSLRESGTVTESKLSRAFGRTLVVIQVTLSVVLMSSAALFVGHLLRLRGQDTTGFRRDNVLIVHLDPSRSGYNPERLARAYEDILDRLQQSRLVRSASIAAPTPVSGAAASRFVTVPGFNERLEDRRYVSLAWVAPRYFDTLGMRLIAGRDFRREDRSGPRIAIINQAMERYYFRNRVAVGQYLIIDNDSTPYEIVGVVSDAKYSSIQEAPPRTVYLNTFQARQLASGFIIHTRGAPYAAAPEVRQAINEVLRTVPVFRITSLSDQVDASMIVERVIASLSGVFACIGCLLAGLGIYGLLSYTTARRTHEIGVRMALGATRATVARMVILEAITLTFLGLIFGSAIAFWCKRYFTALVPDLPAIQAATLMFGVFVTIAVALIAVALPAYRASRVEPMTALRYE
jgi:putative ABC transport system permease protein